MQTNLVSWNPCSRSQFISYSKDKLHLLEFYSQEGTSEGVAERSVREIKAWDAQQLVCLDWRPPTDGPVLAYGTGIGTVHLLNAETGDEVCAQCLCVYSCRFRAKTTNVINCTDICFARN